MPLPETLKQQGRNMQDHVGYEATNSHPTTQGGPIGWAAIAKRDAKAVAHTLFVFALSTVLCTAVVVVIVVGVKLYQGELQWP